MIYELKGMSAGKPAHLLEPFDRTKAAKGLPFRSMMNSSCRKATRFSMSPIRCRTSIVSDRAKRDVSAIHDWLRSQQAGDAGERWFVGLRTAVVSLSTAQDWNARWPGYESGRMTYLAGVRHGANISCNVRKSASTVCGSSWPSDLSNRSASTVRS